MKALVLGGTGIIGNHIVRALLQEGMDVRTLERGLTPAWNMEGLPVERVQGDLSDETCLKKAFKGVQWVFFAAGYYPQNPFHLDQHLMKAKNMLSSLHLAVKSSSIDRLIYTSSLTTIGYRGPHESMASEKDPYHFQQKPPHPYFAVKHWMEEEMKRWWLEESLPVVIVNPTGCFGPFEQKPLHLCLIPQLVNQTVPAYVDYPINVVNVEDVAQGHLQAAERGQLGERYILGDQNVTSAWVIQKVCSIAGVHPPRWKVPINLALAGAWTSEWLAAFLIRGMSPLSVLGLQFLRYGQCLSIEKAKEKLKYRPQGVEKAFEKSITWFKKIGYCPE